MVVVTKAHTQRTFHVEIDHISDLVVKLASHATEAVLRATQALLDGDLNEAQKVIDGDDALDSITVTIEEKCQRLLILQQPMAIDLRTILSALWITSELERTGDLATNICKGTRRIFGAQLTPKLRGLITEMSEEAVRLTRLGVDSFAEKDSGLAAALHDIDDRLDGLHRSFVKEIIEAGVDSTLKTQAAVQLALIARYYERIGDHAVNIGERVFYMVGGWAPENMGAARERERRRLESMSYDLDNLSDNRDGPDESRSG